MHKHRRTYYITVSILFFVVALLHLIRALAGWPLIVGGAELPVWISWVVAILLLYLAIRGIYNARR